MKLRYLGTGGGGGIPELFCSCPVCLHARRVGGRERRRRPMALVDDTLCIDLPCDAASTVLELGADTAAIRHILITHAHYDHFLPDNLLTRPEGAAKAELYISPGSGAAFAKRCEKLSALPVPAGMLPINAPKVHLVGPFESFRAGEHLVTALPSDHAPGLDSLNYLIEREGKAILWLHDCGLLSETAKNWLTEECPRLSLVSMDCALPVGSPPSKEHMDIDTCASTADYLRDLGCADERTVFILSHISHNVRMNHAELSRAATAFGLVPAFDGMEIIL